MFQKLKKNKTSILLCTLISFLFFINIDFLGLEEALLYSNPNGELPYGKLYLIKFAICIGVFLALLLFSVFFQKYLQSYD